MLKIFSLNVNGTIYHAAPTNWDSVPPPAPNTSFMMVSLHKLRDQDFQSYRQIVTDTLELASKEVITSHISAKYELKDVNEAISYINAKKCTGKVVIEVDS